MKKMQVYVYIYIYVQKTLFLCNPYFNGDINFFFKAAVLYKTITIVYRIKSIYNQSLVPLCSVFGDGFLFSLLINFVKGGYF